MRRFRMMSKLMGVLGAAALTAITGAIFGGPARAADTEIVLGAIVPSSGPFAEWGRTNTATLQMLEKQVNDSGGINGAKLRILILDDATKPAQATNNLRKLAGDDHVLAVAGPLTSSAAEVTFPVANEMKACSAAPLCRITSRSSASRRLRSSSTPRTPPPRPSAARLCRA